MSRKSIRRLLVVSMVAAALGAALLLDLANRGLAWRGLYNITGEEQIPGQVLGLMEWGGRWFRTQPRLAPQVAVQHAGEVPFGVNVFLEQEVEIEKRERTVQMARAAGFVWLRQEFPWEDIEIHGKGDFEDRRSDRNGDGQITDADIISAWNKYDNIVDIAEANEMRLMVRLSNPPSWTHASEDAGDKGPPDDLQDYIDYVTTVAARYQGRITHYQIWNEPNIFPEWGNNDVNAADYADMLCRAHTALKNIDPDIVVVSGAFAPTVSMTYRDLNDFIYLEQFFDAGGGDCFDVFSVQGYGLNSGPTDRRLRPMTVNFNRILYLRDMLVARGYAHKPIWISEAAWNPVPPDVPDIAGREQYGVVTEEQAARYAVQAYERQMQEWDGFTGVMFYWFFKRAGDSERNQSWYYFRLTEPDFTPLPAYDALAAYTSTLTPTLYRGTHQARHWALSLAEGAETITEAGAQFDEAARTTGAAFTAHGTEVAVRWRSDTPVTLTRDGETLATLPPGDWSERRYRLGWTASPHTLQLQTDAPFLLDSVTVYNNTVRDIAILGGITVVVAAVFVVGLAARRRS